MTKKTPKILNAHAKKRAEQRYDVDLNKHARHEIVSMIQNGGAEFVSKQSNNRSLWKVNYQEKTMNVVYDRARSTLCTVLPPEAHEFHKPSDWKEAEKEHIKTQSRKDITAELSEIWKDVE